MDAPSQLTSDPSASSTILPSLPVEMIQLILDFTEPPTGYDHWKDRSTTLRSLSLVCKQWCSTWQPRLLSHVVLRSVKQSELLAQVVRDERLAEMVEAVSLGTHWDAKRPGADGNALYFHLVPIFRRCSRIEQIYVGRMDCVDYGDLARVKSLRFLAVFDSLTISARLPLGLRSLRHLSLEFNVGSANFAPHEHHQYPALTALALDSVLWPLIHFPGLLCFSQRANDPLGEPLQPMMEGLILVHFDVEMLRSSIAEAFKALPTTLRFLRVTAGHFFGSDVLTPGLTAHRHRLTRLEELILPLRLQTGAAFQELREWTAREGVRIRYERDEEGQGTVWDEGWWRCVRRVEALVETEREEERRLLAVEQLS